MLGSHYRLRVKNTTGVTIDVAIDGKPWKITTGGALVYGTTGELFYNAALTNGSASAGATQDNSTNKFIGLHLTAVITPSASATGFVSVQLEHSVDDGITWPGTDHGLPVMSTYFSADSAARTVNGMV